MTLFYMIFYSYSCDDDAGYSTNDSWSEKNECDVDWYYDDGFFFENNDLWVSYDCMGHFLISTLTDKS